ncbi:MAG: hypothetical protein DI582_10360 [Azospirillum brasilense]|nr:MAG: hypothetical protein DI582_10360 [Azospirillum brasilense]
MKKILTSLLVLTLLSATLLETPTHCHGNDCGMEEQHAMIDHDAHDHESHGNEAPDEDSGSDNMAKSGLHGWHSHTADVSLNKQFTAPTQVSAMKVQFVYEQHFASRDISPPTEPPSIA